MVVYIVSKVICHIYADPIQSLSIHEFSTDPITVKSNPGDFDLFLCSHSVYLGDLFLEFVQSEILIVAEFGWLALSFTFTQK